MLHYHQKHLDIQAFYTEDKVGGSLAISRNSLLFTFCLCLVTKLQVIMRKGTSGGKLMRNKRKDKVTKVNLKKKKSW